VASSLTPEFRYSMLRIYPTLPKPEEAPWTDWWQERVKRVCYQVMIQTHVDYLEERDDGQPS